MNQSLVFYCHLWNIPLYTSGQKLKKTIIMMVTRIELTHAYLQYVFLPYLTYVMIQKRPDFYLCGNIIYSYFL
ncbi:hypothetical protein QFZ28_002458 [Neobacillus niacini]|nr:hypothetical protein [Neobacillus niacini]